MEGVHGQAERSFELLAAHFLGEPKVSQGTGFGKNPGLRVSGKIFAMIARGELVVKLPKERVDQLLESGNGTRFDAGKGRPMKEWASVPLSHRRLWKRLAEQAFEFVGSGC